MTPLVEARVRIDVGLRAVPAIAVGITENEVGRVAGVGDIAPRPGVAAGACEVARAAADATGRDRELRVRRLDAGGASVVGGCRAQGAVEEHAHTAVAQRLAQL